MSRDIGLRLSAETGTAQLATYRGELQGLLAATRAGDVTAAERAPDVANQFIRLAERQFQGAAGLGAARDFVTEILDQIGSASEGFGKERLSELALAEQQVSLLDDIVEILGSPNPALAVLERIQSNGEIQNARLSDLLDQYIQLSYSAPQNFTPAQVQQAAQQAVVPSSFQISNTVLTNAPDTVTAVNAASDKASSDAADMQQAIDDNARAIQDLSDQISKLESTLRLRPTG